VTEIRNSGNPTNQAKSLLISQSHLVERSGVSITGDHTTITVPSQSLWIKSLTETEKSGMAHRIFGCLVVFRCRLNCGTKKFPVFFE
jgi:hypothetical protein